MTKYKLYKFSGAMYIVPSDEYDYVDEIVESYFTDYRDWETDRKSTRLNSSHSAKSRMPSSA